MLFSFNSLIMLCIKESLFKLADLSLLFNANLLKKKLFLNWAKCGEYVHSNITFGFNLDNAINASLLKCQ